LASVGLQCAVLIALNVLFGLREGSEVYCMVYGLLMP
jgi:hypothetical protein